MKNIIVISSVIFSFCHLDAYAQSRYTYTQDDIIRSSSYDLRVTKAFDTMLELTDAENAYGSMEGAVSSDPSFIRDANGYWNIDYSKITRPNDETVKRMIGEAIADAIPILSRKINGKEGQIWIMIHTDAFGRFLNAEIVLWTPSECYSRIEPEKLAQLYSRISSLSFGIPSAYSAISDHYFRYAFFFKDF